MSLQEYRRKRRFDATPEPAPGKRASRAQRPIFVVQLHHASRRHYDFRLQVGDALKSWAVPKGPSYDPAVKRMAVEVEDHPLDYAQFEGDIPKGHYGGGHVARFDSGVWSTDGDPEAQLRKGHLRFELFGERLKGGWHLVRSGKPAKQPQWLLFKERDDYAGTLEADDLLVDVTPPPAADARRAGRGKAGSKQVAAPPRRARGRRVDWAAKAAKLPGARQARLADAAFAPQLAKQGTAPPAGSGWLHELKWDGYRLVATVVGGRVRLWSRNGIEWTQKLPDVRDAIARLCLDAGALDGELIAGRGTVADFNRLQATLAGDAQAALSFVLFDLLHLDGVAIDRAPLHARKALLRELLGPTPPARLGFSAHVDGEAAAAFAAAAEGGFEGLISKRADRPYHGGRSDDWRKSKRVDSDEFAVVGYTPGKGARSAGIGSLLLARPDGAGGWTYAGRVGSGFDDAMLRTLAKKIGKRGDTTPTAAISAEQRREIGRDVRWFAPAFVVEVNARGTGGLGVLRQASLKALRTDKSIADLADSDRGPAAKRASTETGMATKKTARKAALPAGDVAISSPDKPVFAQPPLRKRDVADYYLAVMDHLLPEIAGRPLSVIRCPDGTAGTCFFQKHLTSGLKRVGTARLKEESGAAADYLVVADAAGLMELVQFNALEFHPWGASAKKPDVADRIVFDLDPGPGVAFAEVRRAAVDVRKRLAALGLQSFLRTTGGKGLHVVVPLAPAVRWDLVRRFARGIAEAFAGTEPERFVAVAALKKRTGRIYIDYLRNGRGATAVASYSLRARPGAPVAMPLAWSALAKLDSPAKFTLLTVPAILRRRRADPWAAMAGLRQDLSAWQRA